MSPSELAPYSKAFSLKEKRRKESELYSAWLNGLYFKLAVVSAFNSNEKYPERPIGIDKLDQEEDVHKIVKNAKEEFEIFSIMYNSELRRKQK